MRVPLTPLSDGGMETPSPLGNSKQSYARIEEPVLIALAQAMPDCQSAILTCLTWQAARQQRFSCGLYAGQFVARLSGPQLARMTGRPLRTVRHALSRLKRAGRVRAARPGPGKTAVYSPVLETPRDA